MASVHFTEDDKKIIDAHPVKSSFFVGQLALINSESSAEGMKFKLIYVAVF